MPLNSLIQNLLKKFKVEDPEDLFDKLMNLILKFANHGVIHGDFNEFNIMLTDDGKPIIIDFPQVIHFSWFLRESRNRGNKDSLNFQCFRWCQFNTCRQNIFLIGMFHAFVIFSDEGLISSPMSFRNLVMLQELMQSMPKLAQAGWRGTFNRPLIFWKNIILHPKKTRMLYWK